MFSLRHTSSQTMGECSALEMESKCSPHFVRGDMSLDKSIAHGKEHRKPYRGSKAIDPTCRNHGGCPWCEENRKHKFRDKEKDYRDRLQADD